MLDFLCIRLKGQQVGSRGQRPRALVAVGAGVITSLLLSGCAAGVDEATANPRPAYGPAGGGCVGWDASFTSDAVGEPTPRQALDTWVAANSGRANPAVRAPTVGWGVAEPDEQGRGQQFRNGRSSVHVIPGAAGTWLVDSTTTCG